MKTLTPENKGDIVKATKSEHSLDIAEVSNEWFA